jgi:cyclic beta-1,2-glucan synthetase
LDAAASDAGDRARALLRALADAAARAGELAHMEQSFLYDDARHLMTIGYNVDERRVDTGYYDLLASEARLGVFVAIAQGQIGQESWFALGRLLTSAAGTPVLLSWSGSMFEYLMPMLLMPSYENTLLDQTCRGAVQRQIEFGNQQGVPWGISESGYNGFDTALNYQYRAFGVPGLGLKRGLADDLVVAPYASMMALMVAPEQACENLQRLAAMGAGWPPRAVRGDRLHPGAPAARTEEHGGAFVHGAPPGDGAAGAGHLLLDRPMQRHFEADPALQATLLLLQERVPRAVTFQPDFDQRAATAAPPRPTRHRSASSPAAPTPPRPRCSCCPTAATT